jgi:hypothetical protein
VIRSLVITLAAVKEQISSPAYHRLSIPRPRNLVMQSGQAVHFKILNTWHLYNSYKICNGSMNNYTCSSVMCKVVCRMLIEAMIVQS